MELENIYELLRAHPLFKDADPAKLSEYITEEDTAICTFAAGKEICSPLSHNVPVGILVSGSASRYSSCSPER